MRQSRPAGRGLFAVVWVRVVTSRFVIGSGAQAAVLGWSVVVVVWFGGWSSEPPPA